MLRESQKWLRMGSIRSAAALPRMAVCGRAFLSEHADHNPVRYDKDGLGPQSGITSPSPFQGKKEAAQRFRPLCQPTAASGTESVEAK